jgi:hypothetical protein
VSSTPLGAGQNSNTTEQHEAVASGPQISYLVPKTAVFQRFAQQVGEQMAETFGDPRYAEQAVVDGLANFLTVVCELTVKRLNSVSRV